MGRKRKTKLHLPQHIYFKDGSYYFVKYIEGKKKWTRLDSNFSKAMAKWAKLVDEPRKLPTMAAVIDRYMLEVAPEKAFSTYKEFIRQSKILKAVFGHMQPMNVDQQNIYKYLDARKNKNAPIAGNREVALLSSIFKKAIRWGAVKINPCVGIERNEEKERDRYITNEEFNERKTIMPQWISIIMDIAYLTSLRKADILKIKLSDIKNNELTVIQNKTGAKQKFMLLNEKGSLNDLGIAINKGKLLRRTISGLYLFCNSRGKPYTTGGFDSIWQRHLKKDNIQDFRFHDLRAKSITDAEDQGINPKKLSGHKTSQMVDRYLKTRKFERVKPLKFQK